MKVLHVSTAESWRGGEQQITYLVGELTRLGISQEVCCPDGSPLHTRCRSLSVELAPFRSRGLLDSALAKKISSLCKSRTIQVIHAHDSHAHAAAVIAAAFLGNTVPIVLSRRVDFPVSPNFLSRWKYNHSSVHKILCVSKKIEDVMRRDLADPGRLCVIYDGIDLERFQSVDRSLLRREFNIADGTPIVGNASALADHKDYYTFVETAARIVQSIPNIRFVILGDGPEKAGILRHIAELRLENNFLLTGFRSDVHSLLPSFDVFLMTSVTEGLGSVVLDAFAAGVPVVATRAGGIPEIVHHEETGLLAAVKDSAQLAQEVMRILADPSLANRLKEKAATAVRAFSKDHMAKATLAVYEEVMKK